MLGVSVHPFFVMLHIFFYSPNVYKSQYLHSVINAYTITCLFCNSYKKKVQLMHTKIVFVLFCISPKKSTHVSLCSGCTSIK